MTALDKVLAALDAGLQSSDEQGYPTRVDHDGLCARCLREERPEQGDLCAGCRAWMLGDSDVDPASSLPRGVSMNAASVMYARREDSVGDVVVEPLGVSGWTFTNVDHRESSPRFVFHATGACRVQRLDRDGQPVGEPMDLSGLALHHRDGNPHNNDIANLEVVPVASSQEDSDFRDAMRRTDVALSLGEVDTAALRVAFGALSEPSVDAADSTLHLAENVDRRGHDAYMAEREQAFQRLAEGLSVPPELLEASRGVYDWAREEEVRVAAERQNVRPETEEESRQRVALGESWEAFSAVRQVQALQRRIERSQ